MAQQKKAHMESNQNIYNHTHSRNIILAFPQAFLIQFRVPATFHDCCLMAPNASPLSLQYNIYPPLNIFPTSTMMHHSDHYFIQSIFGICLNSINKQGGSQVIK